MEFGLAVAIYMAPQSRSIHVMREIIIMMGFNLYDREIMTKVFSEKYDLHFLEKTDKLSWSGKDQFFKLVICNMDIPDEENLCALECMRKQDAFERPVIVITSQTTIDVARFLATTGVFYHLVRPFEMRDLDDLITGALRFWQKKRIDSAVPVRTRRVRG
jgi:DNA-binding NtrC family response regulator